MEQLMNYPVALCVVIFALLWAAARIGTFFRSRRSSDEVLADEYAIVLGATLTLLGLLIGFSFSMAVSRYDLRKNYEEEEANAIGTEYLRADLLPTPVRLKVRQQLIQYLDLRIRKYESHASADTAELDRATAQLQNEMWNQVQTAAQANPTPIMETVVTGMNDVINRQGYSHAARRNRIPLPAWGLMAGIALISNFLVGYGEKRLYKTLLLILPLAIGVSFLLIADIDSPQGGLIRVAPKNLITLADSLKSQ